MSRGRAEDERVMDLIYNTFLILKTVYYTMWMRI
jgi:hypothetical protein